MSYEISISDIIKKPKLILRKLSYLEKLKNTFENNEWHKNQNVLDHTLKVFSLLDKIFELDLKYLDKITSFQKKVENYLYENIGNENSRRNMLKVAALFHDISKPLTLQTDKLGGTTCPNHAVESAKLFSKIENINLNSKEKEYVIKIIKYHHTADTFIDHLGLDDYKIKQQEFIEDNIDVCTDLLIFHIADLEGCDVTERINNSKFKIYPEVSTTIIKCLENYCLVAKNKISHGECETFTI